MNYYNENDPKVAAWLRALIAVGLIPQGEVDERSIEDVVPSDLRGFVQCHFFAGIAGWSHALDLAGWPRDRPVWTGSCPCQPFSAAGQGIGFADERHLWPAWQHLIAQCRPAIVFGEQVASKAAETWLDLVQADMEGMDYAFACVPFPSASVGSPHIRDRTYWGAVRLADFGATRLQVSLGDTGVSGIQAGPDARETPVGSGVRAIERLANPNGRNASAEREQCSGEQRQQPEDGGAVRVANPNGPRHVPAALGSLHSGEEGAGSRNGESERRGDAGERPGPLHGFWSNADWLLCRDGKWRPVIPEHVGVADGLPDCLVRSGDSSASDTETGEEIDGKAGNLNTGEALLPLRQGNGAQEVQRDAGGSLQVPCQEVLRQDVHGHGDAEGSLPKPKPQPNEGGQNGSGSMRGLRGDRKAARTPPRRGPFQQRPIELEDVVRSLPSALALAELHGRRRDAEALRALCAAICKAGAVPFSPVATEAAWQSLGREGQDRIRVGFGSVWVARTFFPLSQGEEARTTRLRGYGNAINPHQAAQFILASIEAIADRESARLAA